MIEIVRHRLGTCDSCKQKTGDYTILGGPDEWQAPNKLCQKCMLSLVCSNEVIRNVLLLQSGTNE